MKKNDRLQILSYGDYPDLQSVKKILVMKLRHLGDVLLATPVFQALKERFPEAEIDAYVYREAFPMLQGHPAITRLIGCDRNWKRLSFFQRMKREVGCLRDLRASQYDLTINLTEGDRGTVAALVSGAKVRVGKAP